MKIRFDPGLTAALNAADRGAQPSPGPPTGLKQIQHAISDALSRLPIRSNTAPDRRLRHAALRGDLDAVNKALKQGADPRSLSGGKQYNAIHAAAQSGRPAVMEALLASIPDNDPSVNAPAATFGNPTPLIIAAATQDVEIAQLLLDAGADANSKTTAHPTSKDSLYQQPRTAADTAAHVLRRSGQTKESLDAAVRNPVHILHMLQTTAQVPSLLSDTRTASGTASSSGALPSALSGRNQLSARPMASGLDKEIYPLIGNDSLLVAMPRQTAFFSSGRDELDDEVSAIGTLKALGFPVVNVHGVIPVGHEFGILQERVPEARSSKDPRAYQFLNERSIEDLRSVERLLMANPIHVVDLQFLVGRDGRVVICDPMTIEDRSSPENLDQVRRLLARAGGAPSSSQ
jgi:ankyrin repeat protein